MNALAVSQAALAQHDTVILLPGFTAASYIAAASAHRATTLTSVPTMIAMMLREPDAAGARTTSSSVTAVRMGSAPVSPGLMEAARRTFPDAVGRQQPTARPRPARSSSPRTPMADRPPTCRSASRIRKSSCG